MTIWLNIEMLKPHAMIRQVLCNFVAYFTRDLKEWQIILDGYRQLQLTLLDIDLYMFQIYTKFIGYPKHIVNQVRGEYFKLKYCFFNPKDLVKYFKKI